ncbi:hypothetical protein PLICRDRAFT_40769 [Plicaturopsis crispa FD-325 SS-3]|nr:hypothetical protein PLICRDRAFT_40769 [Plicaturopsis crispa FD-325 SS-3]
MHATPRRLEHYLNANPEVFRKAVEKKDRVVLVDFYADWCNPCKTLSPILEKLTEDPTVKSGSGHPVDLVTIDTDGAENYDLVAKHKVRSLPTVVAFKDGEPVNQFVGAINEAGVRKFIGLL